MNTLQEIPQHQAAVTQTYPELIQDYGKTLEATETVAIQELGGDNDIAGRISETIVAGNSEITGIPSLVVRVGGENTYTDMIVMDIRQQPEVGKDRHGRPIRTIGTESGHRSGAVGDFVLVSRSDDGEKLSIQALYPGSRWEIGRNPGKVGSAGHSPSTLSRDHCAIGLDENGSLIVENQSPSNMTKIFRPETIDLGLGQVQEPDEPDTSGEKHESMTRKDAVELLSYSDVLEGSEYHDAKEYTNSNPSGQKYTETLLKTADQIGAKAIVDVAKTLREACLHELTRLGIKPSKFAESLSWAVWDLTKQRYLLEHPEESNQEYDLADPFGNDEAAAKLLDEIVDRHIGWEYDRVNAVHEGQRNKTGQLRSIELARVGHELRAK